MVRYVFAILLMVLAFQPAVAQGRSRAEHERMRKELIEFKIEYLIQETDLAADRQAEFERLYLQMEEERHNLFKSTFSKNRAARRTQAPETDVAAAADAMAAMKQKEGTLELRYYQLFKKFMSPRQLYNLKRAEERFNRKVMEMRGRDDASPSGRGRKK